MTEAPVFFLLLADSAVTEEAPRCVWLKYPDSYLAGCCDDNCASFNTLGEAETSCLNDPCCGGVTVESDGMQCKHC